MLCQMCHVNEANFFQTKSINGVTSKACYCTKCATEKGLIQKNYEPFSFHQFVAGLVNDQKVVAKRKSSATPTSVCPNCQLSLADFKFQGKFGCELCYQTFKEYIPVIIKHFQAGNLLHKGKIPKRFKISEPSSTQLQNNQINNILQQIAEQKNQLMNYILEEQFELAALARDNIRALEVQLKEVTRENEE